SSFLASIGGTQKPGGTVTYTTYIGLGNGLFDESNQLTTSGTMTGNPFSSDVGSLPVSGNPISLTLKVVIHHAAGSGINSSGDAELQLPDGGSTVSLLGAALLTISIFAVRRKKSATV